jgi:FdhE protein
VTREGWLAAHPYLRPLADFGDRVDRAAAGLEGERTGAPDWDAYRDDFLAGIPLLRSPSVSIDLEPAGRMVVALVGRLASEPLLPRLAAETRRLDAELRSDPESPDRVAAWLLGDETDPPGSPGLLRHLGWTAMARWLAPLVQAYAAWRDEERWLRRYCPTCGAAPAMAQLVASDAGRKRLLSCGACRTRWEYRRTLCPFCEEDSQKLATVTVEGEGGLRIDYCGSCRGYLKTYAGEGDEALLLADWSSLHLDLAARDRGLKRLASSLYELESAGAEATPASEVAADA